MQSLPTSKWPSRQAICKGVRPISSDESMTWGFFPKGKNNKISGVGGGRKRKKEKNGSAYEDISRLLRGRLVGRVDGSWRWGRYWNEAQSCGNCRSVLQNERPWSLSSSLSCLRWESDPSLSLSARSSFKGNSWEVASELTRKRVMHQTVVEVCTDRGTSPTTFSRFL